MSYFCNHPTCDKIFSTKEAQMQHSALCSKRKNPVLKHIKNNSNESKNPEKHKCHYPGCSRTFTQNRGRSNHEKGCNHKLTITNHDLAELYRMFIDSSEPAGACPNVLNDKTDWSPTLANI